MAHALPGRSRSRAAAALLLVMLFCAPAFAGDFSASAVLFVSGLGAEATAPRSASDPPTRRLGALLEKFDFPGFGQLTLGRYWTDASPGQRHEFSALLTAMFARSYGGYLDAYAGGRLEIIGSRSLAADAALVASRLVDAAGQNPLRIDWVVRARDGGAPKVGDVIVAGISMARTDADEFGSLLRGAGLEGLLQQLHAKYRDTTLIGAAE